jgi:hypothetical protein
MSRDVFSASMPPSGDYFLSPTGVAWNVRRCIANGSVLNIAVEPDWKSALTTLLSLAQSDQADAWETAGGGSYRLIKRYRPAR